MIKNEIIKLKSKRYKYNTLREKSEISKLCGDLPDEKTVYKFISAGSFSSIGFVSYVASKTKITDLYVSTLRIGAKQMKTLNELHSRKKIINATFVVGGIMKRDNKAGRSYGYYDVAVNSCEKNGWKIIVTNNHSKIILLNTEKGKFVIETSSNLNENPHMEQFSFEKSEKLYDFYLKVFGHLAETGNKVTVFDDA